MLVRALKGVGGYGLHSGREGVTHLGEFIWTDATDSGLQLVSEGGSVPVEMGCSCLWFAPSGSAFSRCTLSLGRFRTSADRKPLISPLQVRGTT